MEDTSSEAIRAWAPAFENFTFTATPQGTKLTVEQDMTDEFEEMVEAWYSWAPPLNGGFTVLELPSRDEAVAWAARIAKACRCDQELRVFGFDPAS